MTVKIKQGDMRTSSPEFQENFRNYAEVLKGFREKLALVSSHGGEAAVEKHRSRGKLLARERINLLVDQNTPFLELSSFAAYNQYKNAFPSAGIITGIGVVQGRECLIIANDATVKGGTYIRETIKKHVRAQEIARQNKLILYLFGRFGRNLPS